MEDSSNDRLVVYQPSMSKTDDLLACTWPFGRRFPKGEAIDAARFGSAAHACYAEQLQGVAPEVEAHATKFDVEAEELEDHVRRTYPNLEKWLTRSNPYKTNFLDDATDIKIEISMALFVAAGKKYGTAREIDPPDEKTHEYHGVDHKKELPGTLDLVIHTPRYRLVVDHKTGFDIPQVEGSGQLLSAVAAVRTMRPKVLTTIAGYFHAPRSGGGATVYAEEVSPVEIDNHVRRLKYAFKRVGDGRLKPGAACTYCPAYTICPAHGGSTSAGLVELRRKPNGIMTAADVGRMHQALNEYDGLAKKLRAEIKSWVAANGPVSRPDGKEIAIVMRPFTNLSMESIKRKLGKLEGGRLIEKLEKQGVIERGERPTLVAGDAE